MDEVSLLFDIRWSPPPPDSYCEVKNCRNCNRKVIFDKILSLYRTYFELKINFLVMESIIIVRTFSLS